MHEYHVKIKILSSGIRLRFKTSRCECTTLPHRPTAIRGDRSGSFGGDEMSACVVRVRTYGENVQRASAA